MATKKTTPKKTAAKKVTTTKRKKTARSPQYVSFRRSPNVGPFVTFTPTIQTVYWTVIGLVVLALGVYVVYLQMEINRLYDQVDSNGTQVELNRDDIKKIQE